MNYTITSRTHSKWLESRSGGIGSSEVATLMGVNKYDTPYQLWLRKTGQVPTVEKENFLMKAGHYLEDAISKFCADDTGLEIIKSSASEFVVINKEKPFLRVSPDRYAWLPNARHTRENKYIIECKSSQNQIDPDDLPKAWFCQVMYQLGVTELEQAYIAWLIQGREFGCKELHFDKDFFGLISEVVERFWIDNVIGGEEPELTTIEDVTIKYPRPKEGKKAYASDELIEIWGELRDKSDQIKRLEAEKEALVNSLKASMLDAESLVIPSTGDTPEKTLVTWRGGNISSRFNVDAFKAAEPETYAKYVYQEQTARRFCIK